MHVLSVVVVVSVRVEEEKLSNINEAVFYSDVTVNAVNWHRGNMLLKMMLEMESG